MGVATRGTAGRWAVAVTLVAAVGLAPAAIARLPVQDTTRSPQEIVAAALGSAGIPHEGLAESTGILGLPDLPRLGDVAALLGSTTRARVWWRSPDAWRVDRITTTGESGVYKVPFGVRTWDFESDRARQEFDTAAIRLPRVDDLLPPQAVRRALAGVTRADRLRPLPARRVAGRRADGVRVRPADTSSTIGRLDLYVDRRTGLPLSLVVVPRGSDLPALRTRFVQVSLTRPGASVLVPRTPPSAEVRATNTPDLATAVDRYAPFALPQRLAGLPRSRGLVGEAGGTATYGRGLARFVLLPLRRQEGRPAIDAATAGGGVPLDVGSGEVTLVSTPLLNVVLGHAHDGPSDRRGRYYLIAGAVAADTLETAIIELFADPPPLRTR